MLLVLHADDAPVVELEDGFQEPGDVHDPPPELEAVAVGPPGIDVLEMHVHEPVGGLERGLGGVHPRPQRVPRVVADADPTVQVLDLFVDRDGRGVVLVLGAVGIPLYAIRLKRLRRTRCAPMMIGLAVYHYGMVIFSLVDFQGHGDVFVLLASWAFFAAVPVAEAYYGLLRLRSRLRGRVARSYGPVLGLLTVSALVVACRPSFLREGWRYNSPLLGWSNYELDSQRQAAERFFQVVGDRPFALVRNQELLFLGEAECPLPFVTWNQGTYVHYRQGEENRVDTLSRLLRQEDLDFIVLPKTWLPYLQGTAFAPWLLVNYSPIMVSSQDEKYFVIVWAHRRVPPPAVRGVRYVEIESLWLS